MMPLQNGPTILTLLNRTIDNMLKKTLIRVVGETARGVDPNMSRLDKFEVFCRVCDNLLEDGRITSAQHSSWTNIF